MPATKPETIWVPDHFIGGHPALDLTNAVYDRLMPLEDAELLNSAKDVGNWFRAAALADDVEATAIAELPEASLLPGVREVRETSHAVFKALAEGDQPPSEALGFLFRTGAGGLETGSLEMTGTSPTVHPRRWSDAGSVIALLAMLAIEAFFNLPRERLGSCPRCGWLFVDTSRGGRRRWCSMRTCGNREKVSRHYTPSQ